MTETPVVSMMDRGNVGIIRSPVRASILPDLPVMSVYGTELAKPALRPKGSYWYR